MLLEPAHPGDSFAVLRSTASSVAQRFDGTSQRTILRPAPRRLSVWDVLGMLAGFLLTYAVTVVNSHGRIFWEDEMLGWLLLRDPSWHHMIRAWNLGADGGGFSFYLLGRPWFRLFGDSFLSFRLFSSTCFGLGFVATWAALRRFYPTWIVAFATFNTFFFSPPLTMHYIEGRFYGLLVMNTALALWLALVLDEAPEPTPRRLYLAAFVIHGLLTTSHLLGVVYSLFIVLATVVLDRLRRRRRLGLYLSAAASWLLLVPEKASILAAGRVGKPHFWTKPPTPWEVLGAYTGDSREILLVLLLAGIGAALYLRRSTGGFRHGLRDSYHRRCAVYLVTGCLLLVPVWFLAEGLVGTWLFNSRYLQPVTMALAYLTAELVLLASQLALIASLKRRWPQLFTAAALASSVLFGLFTLVWVFHHVSQYTPEAPDFTQELTDHLPHNIPVVVEDAFTFTGLLSRQANSGVQYTFLLDWPYAISPGAPRLEVTQYHLMQNWKNAGYFSGHIQNAATFLAQHPVFLIVHNTGIHPDPKDPKPEIGNPIASRLAHTPGYQLEKYFTLDRLDRDSVRDVVWLVCRGGCATAPSLPHGADSCMLSPHGSSQCCTGPACKLPEPEAPPRFWQVSKWRELRTH